MTLSPFRSQEQKVVTPVQGSDVYKNISEQNIELSWRYTLPTNSRFKLFKVLTRYGDNLHAVAEYDGNQDPHLVIRSEAPGSFYDRITATKTGIIINSLNFEEDHDRKFFAELEILSQIGSIISYSSIETTLNIKYSPEFLNFKTDTLVDEKSEGRILAVIRSFPRVLDAKWELIGMGSIEHTDKELILTPDIKKMYNIPKNSKFSYYVTAYYYKNLPRKKIGTLKCTVIGVNNIVYSASTIIRVNYPVDPPGELKALNVTDHEVLVEWKKPLPESGNPGVTISYNIEYTPVDLKSNNIRGRAVNNNDNTPDTVKEINYQQLDQSSWKTMNSTSEKVALYNLKPNSHYVVRVRAYNGKSYSEPSERLVFTTLPSRRFPSSQWSVTQPLIMIIVVTSAIISVLVLILSVVCYVRVKKRKSREWAVFKRPGSSFLRDAKMSENYEYPPSKVFEPAIWQDDRDGLFDNMPPVEIPTSFLDYYHSPMHIPEEKLDSVSLHHLNPGNTKNTPSNAGSTIQIQNPSRYISPIMGGDLRSFDSSSLISGCTSKTAYV